MTADRRLSLPLWHERHAAPMAPTSAAEMRARGWDGVDVVFVTGDAYVDHPSFAMAILHRVLEVAGFKVGMLSQPDWRSCQPWQTFGRPRLFFAVSAGNVRKRASLRGRSSLEDGPNVLQPIIGPAIAACAAVQAH